VEPSGKVHQYDKKHLFSFGGEDKIYTPGKERVVVDYKGVRFLLLVCYDLRFPVFARNVDGYDVMIDVASWAEPRILAWETLLRARAIENQSFVFGVNRIGIDGSGLNYPESTRCFYADGTEIKNPESVVTDAVVKTTKTYTTKSVDVVISTRDEVENHDVEYNTADKKVKTITKDGKKYNFHGIYAPSEKFHNVTAETGKVVEGITTIVYQYQLEPEKVQWEVSQNPPIVEVPEFFGGTRRG